MRALGSLLGTAALAASALVLLPAPASASAGDNDALRESRAELAELPETPLVTSGNVQHLGNHPGQVGISGCFQRTAPLFVTSGLDSLQVYDVSDGVRPQRLGMLDSVQFENEAMTCGQRVRRGETRRFALVGVDLYQASSGDIEHVNVGGGELVVVEVTDPANPRIISRTPGSTSTHTVACVDETNCKYAYSAGSSSRGTFSIFDLRDIDHPVELDSDPGTAGVQPFSSPTAGHKWNFDGAGYGTHTGFEGSSVFDTSDPTNPRLVTSTGLAGTGADPDHPGWNDFIHHNSFRPNADAFRPDTEPSFANGNVLLVTEEDYEQTDCAQAGSFQTWWVKRLDGTDGAIVPLDKVELADLGTYPLPQGAFCSSHWFDYHPSGIVAVGFYGGGTQLVDVRDPQELTSWGSAWWGASEVWDAMWLPVYKDGKRMEQSTNVVYSIDLLRGLDVYSVDLPGDGAGATPSAGTDLDGSHVLGSAVLPLGLAGGAMALAVALRRRAPRRT